MKFRSLLAVCAIAFAAVAPVVAHAVQYTGSFLGATEVPPVVSPGFGTALVTIDLGSSLMRVQASFSGLIGTTTNAHIHCCIAPGANVGVATQTPSFGGFPLGVTAGTFDNTFDMKLASSYNAAFITSNGGTPGSAFNALVLGMNSGQSYFNIHTSSFGGGEVRALLAAVPEPESYAMLASGLGLLAFVVRRRRRSV